MLLTQENSQPFVTESIRADDLSSFHLAVLDIIELELLCPAKVLEDLTVFIRHRDSHVILLLFCNLSDRFVFHLLAKFTLANLWVTIQGKRCLTHVLK